VSASETQAQRRAARRSAGPASGVLGGRYPNPGFGLPLGGTVNLDDFVGSIAKTDMRTGLHWVIGDVGPGVTVSGVTSTATERGIFRMTTAGPVTAGGSASLTEGRLEAGVPTYLEWAAKVRSGTGFPNTNVRVWSGYADTALGDPLTANATQFVGVRADPGGAAANWFGVVKDGAGAGNESTVNLGLLFDGTWRILGFTRTTTGIQFWRGDASRLATHGLMVEDLGAEVTTNLPTVPLVAVGVGIRNTSAVAHAIDIDIWADGGPIAR
jgi:hypothetical protein